MDRIDFMMGEVHALQALLQALTVNHPNPLQLAKDAETNFQSGLAKIEGQAVPQSVVNGFQWMANELTSAIPGARRGS